METIVLPAGRGRRLLRAAVSGGLGPAAARPPGGSSAQPHDVEPDTDLPGRGQEPAADADGTGHG
jgi:hypothetical protein